MIGTSASGFARENRVDVAPDAIEQIAARGHAVLDDFVQAGAELAARQRFEQRRIDGDERRMVEGADQVLAERVIDAHLAADRAVDLREQRGRDLDQPDAAQVRGRDEPRHVADDAAADRDDAGAAIGLQLDQRFVRARDRRELLVALAVGQQDRLGARHGAWPMSLAREASTRAGSR